jgi:hypothetical protein
MPVTPYAGKTLRAMTLRWMLCSPSHPRGSW